MNASAPAPERAIATHPRDFPTDMQRFYRFAYDARP
jgi:hypothetical protein